MICVRVSMMRSGFSTAKAGKLMMVRSPASISLELDSRGSRELSFACVRGVRYVGVEGWREKGR